MFADAATAPAGGTVEADLCIVGAGAAGIALALQFVGSPTRVAVLESGELEYRSDIQALTGGHLTGLPYFPLEAARLRWFGGTTNHWGGLCRPFEDADFEARDGIRFTGWPIRKADLEPFYGPAARLCQVPSTDWDVDAWGRRDRFGPFPFDPERIVTRVAQVVPKPSRNFGQTYREQVRRAGNVTVYLDANATSLRTDDAGVTASSVQAASLDGRRFSVTAKLVVLAAGALENPRLLLLSDDRWPSGIGNQHDLVGRFFSEHPRYVAGVLLPSDPRVRAGFYGLHRVGGTTIRAYLALSSAPRVCSTCRFAWHSPTTSVSRAPSSPATWPRSAR